MKSTKLNLLFSLSALLFISACSEMSGEDDVSGRDDVAGGGEYALSSDASGGGEGGQEGDSTMNIDPGQITAGEWSDLENWDYWQNLYQLEDFKDMNVHWGYDLNPRITVSLTNSSKQPLPGVRASLKTNQGETIWESVSDQEGTLQLWPGAYSLDDLVVEIAGKTYSPHSFEQGVVDIELDLNPSISNAIEIAFIVDATGSMADELEYFKVELMDVITEVEQKSSKTVVSGSVFYRDEGDEYVTRISEFNSPSETVKFIQKQEANGGGDWPEAVHTALNRGINNLQWSSGSNPKLAFLLLDAPPHYTDQVMTEIHELIQRYSQQGIKIIPIAASGIDKETEFLLRYFAIATNGTYVFITNHSGIGNEHIEPSIGDYEVEYLNELLIRLILEEIQN